MVLVGLAFFGIAVLFDDGVDQIYFDSDVWKNTPAEFSLESTRLKMVDDFLDKHFIVGMSRDEVISLIGEPDQTEYFKSYEMVYMLGQETDSYFAIDLQWLALDLNDSERVASYNIVTD